MQMLSLYGCNIGLLLLAAFVCWFSCASFFAMTLTRQNRFILKVAGTQSSVLVPWLCLQHCAAYLLLQSRLVVGLLTKFNLRIPSFVNLHATVTCIVAFLTRIKLMLYIWIYQSRRILHGIDLVLDCLSWICCCEIHSACAPHFSSMRFIRLVHASLVTRGFFINKYIYLHHCFWFRGSTFGHSWICCLFWRHVCIYDSKGSIYFSSSFIQFVNTLLG